jgi:hypothetical protein
MKQAKVLTTRRLQNLFLGGGVYGPCVRVGLKNPDCLPSALAIHRVGNAVSPARNAASSRQVYLCRFFRSPHLPGV